jgi:hypothetical protein
MKLKDNKYKGEKLPRKKHSRVLKPKNFDGERAINPFVNDNFVVPVTKETINIGLFKKDKDGNEVSAEKEIYREHQKFVKIYTNLTYDEENEDGERILLNKFEAPSIRKDRAAMSSRAIHLLDWIAQKLDYGKDYVFFDKNVYLSESSIALNTYKAALQEIIDNGFIAYASVKNMYWINPFYMFKGDRVEKYESKKVVVYDDTVEAKEKRREQRKELNKLKENEKSKKKVND